MTTVAIACATGVYALLFSRLSGREGTRCKIGVARIECSNTQRQMHYEEEGNDGKRPFAAFHGSTPFRSKKTTRTTSLERRRKIVIEIQPFYARADNGHAAVMPPIKLMNSRTADDPAGMSLWVGQT